MANKKKEEEQSDFKYIVRMANTDLDGEKTVIIGLTSIKGIGHRTARNIVKKAGAPPREKLGNLSDDHINKLKEMVEDVPAISPIWMLNRRKDYETGDDRHIISTEVSMQLKDDINLLKKARCYRGIRHENGHKVRGQRTRSNGRTGLTLGVSKSK